MRNSGTPQRRIDLHYFDHPVASPQRRWDISANHKLQNIPVTDPAATTDDDGRTSVWRARPFLLGVIAVMLLADLGIAWLWKGSASQMVTCVFLGLSFGQMGAASAWTFAGGVAHRLIIAVASLMLGGMLAFVWWTLSPGGLSTVYLALYALLFLEYQVAVLVVLLGVQLIRRKASSSPWRPQFVVRQLLASMIVTALVATILRTALEDIGVLANPGAIALVATGAIIAILAGVLLLNHPPSLWRLGAFAGLGLAVGYVGSRFIDGDEYFYLSVVQMATLAMCLIVPQFDRYVLRVELEPRERSDPEQHLDENA